MAFQSLTELYDAVNARFTKISNGDCRDQEEITDTIQLVLQCKAAVASGDLFSSNEELEEYSTNSMKYLFLDYFLAKAYGSSIDLRSRKEALLKARGYFQAYLATCCNLHVLHESETSQFNDEFEEGVRVSPVDQRSRKIEAFRREKEAQARMKVIKAALSAAEDDAAGERGGGGGSDGEEEVRELILLQLQSYARDALTELNSIKQELVLLEHMADLRELEEINESCNGPTSVSGRRPGPPGLPMSDCQPPRPGEGPGISITRTEKVGDQLVMSRDVVRAEVFVPRMSGPSMTVEEFGELELQRLAEREAASAEAAAAGGSAPRRYNQLAIDGEEDVSELVDQATVADREWDDWKEHNPKGWGNKMGKRF